MANSASYIDWLDNEDYTLMKDNIKDLKVVNDVADCIDRGDYDYEVSTSIKQVG